MQTDTDFGGGGRFPRTHQSAIRAAGSSDAGVRREGLNTLIEAYWKPVYKYVRLTWRASNEEAKDLTQGFFAKLIDSDTVAGYDPQRGTFRTFLRTCLDRYVSNERLAAQRLKRGGGRRVFSLDFDGADAEFREGTPATTDPDRYFEREWQRALFSRAVERLRDELRASGRATHFLLFEHYDLSSRDTAPFQTYDTLAKAYGLKVTQVTNYLAYTRRRFRTTLLQELRAMTGNEAEFEAEARALLGEDAV